MERKGEEHTDRVGNAAYHHDLCSSKHDDTKTKNEIRDKAMLGELSQS